MVSKGFVKTLNDLPGVTINIIITIITISKYVNKYTISVINLL